MGNIDIFIYNIYKYFLNKRRFWGYHEAVLKVITRWFRGIKSVLEGAFAPRCPFPYSAKRPFGHFICHSRYVSRLCVYLSEEYGF